MAKLKCPASLRETLIELGVDPDRGDYQYSSGDLFIEGFTDDEILSAELRAVPDVLERKKVDAKEDVKRFAEDKTKSLVANYPRVERDGWPTKLAAAEAHLAGTASQMQTDMLATEANIVGITVDQLAQTIVAKAAWFAKVNATISGMRQKAFVAIDAATDLAEVDVILEQMKLDAEKALADLLAVKP